MTAGCRQFERATATLLSTHVSKVWSTYPWSLSLRGDIGRRPAAAAEIRDGFGQVAERDRLHTRQSRLRGGLRRAEDALEADAPCSLGDDQDAPDGAESPIECELADDGVRAQWRGLHLPGGSENRQRD